MQTKDQPPRPFQVRNAGDLGVAVKHYRKRAGLTQAALAERAGLNRTYLAELEGGRSTEAVKRLLEVFRELGVRVTLSPEVW